MRKSVLLCLLVCTLSGSYAQDLLSQQKTERYFAAGTELMDRGQYGPAYENFLRFLSVYPKQDERYTQAVYYHAFCALNLFHADAEKRIQDFIDAYPNHPQSVMAHYDLGNFFYNEKNFKKAIIHYGLVNFKSLNKDQVNTGRFKWGYCLFSQKLLTEALEQFNDIKLQGGQYGPGSSYYAGFIEFSQGDYAAALSDLKRAEQNEGYSKIVPYQITSVLYKQRSYDDLLIYGAEAIKREKVVNSEEISLLMAEAYYKKNDFKNSLPAYQGYLKGKESTADKGVLFRAGFSAYQLKMDDTALQYLKESFSDKDSIGFYSAYYLGSIYLKKGQKPLALSAFDLSRRYTGDMKLMEESTFQYSKLLYDQGFPDMAINELESFSKVFPSSEHITEVKEILSQAYVNANNFNRAIEYIELLPKRSPSIDRAYQKATLLKGLELYNKEAYADAISFLEKSLQYPLDQDYVAEAGFWMGESLSINRNYQEAIASYSKIVALEGYNNAEIKTKTRYGMGYAFFNLKDYEKALFNFKMFVSQTTPDQSNFGDGSVRLADCYYVTKSYNEALGQYRKSLPVSLPDADYIHFQMGVISGTLKKYTDADRELELVLLKYPSTTYKEEAMYQLGQLAFEQGNYAEAVKKYSRLIDSSPSSSRFVPYAHTRRASSYYNLKDYDKTIQDYSIVIKNYPGHPAGKDILLPLQEALNLAGRSGELESYIALIKSSNGDARGMETVEFEVAKNSYFNQEYAKAIERLSNYVKNYPESQKVSEANYYQAECYYRLKDFPHALAAYYVVDTDKTFPMMIKVTSRIAELEFKSGKYDKASDFFKQLAVMATNKKELYIAWNGLMESNYLLARYDSADFYAHQIIEKANVSAGVVNKSSLYLGKSAMARGDYETAKDEFLNTFNSARDEYGAEAKYLLGEVFYRTHEYSQCYETLISLHRDFEAYPYWVGKSYLLLSDNFLVQGDSFQARATLKSLIDNFPLAEVKDKAREKLSKIDEDELKSNQKKQPDSLDNDKNK